MSTTHKPTRSERAGLPPRGDVPVTPWAPSRRATARVVNPLPVPTACPHCDHRVELVSNSKIYGREYGEWPWAFLCVNRNCGAYVGLHPFTGIPLGTLATADIRAARKMAKDLFNPLWQGPNARVRSRSEAYAWLAAQMGIPVERCHFGWFDAAQCERAAQICRKRGIL